MKNMLLFDFDSVFRSDIRTLIESNTQWQMVGDTSDLNDLKAYFSGQRIDIVMIGADLGLKERTALFSWMEAFSSTTKIIWLTGAEEDGSFRIPPFVEGIDGYLLKNIEGQELLLCLQLVSSGGRYLSNQLHMLLMEAKLGRQPFLETFVSQDTAFSSQEIQLLQFVVNGTSQTAIGQKLSMNVNAVKRHFELLFDRTGTDSYSSLIKYALENGIVS